MLKFERPVRSEKARERIQMSEELAMFIEPMEARAQSGHAKKRQSEVVIREGGGEARFQ